MSKSSARSVIRLRGVRHNNLKNFDLDLPLNRLIVITGPSGSGKSSLAFDTLFAEGQRRYIETFSPYARQFFDRMDKPQVDRIEGIPPAIAIEQRNSVRTTRSTVGTMTEICDYLKVLWPQIAQLHCRQCGQVVRKDTPQQIWDALKEQNGAAGESALITFDLPLSDKLSLEESLSLISRQGYQRLLWAGSPIRIEEAQPLMAAQKPPPESLTVIQDRVSLENGSRSRFVEACEQAFHFGKGKLAVYKGSGGDENRGATPMGLEESGPANPGLPGARNPGLEDAIPLGLEKGPSKVEQVSKSRKSPARAAAAQLRFSNQLHCARCDIAYAEPTPAMFSFNHPVGACPTCRGFGRSISIDYRRALPDRSKTLAEGVVKPWQTGMSADCQRDLLKMCRHFEIPTNVPFAKLAKKWQELVIEGEPDYGKDEEHKWPRAWYGVKGYFRWLESKSYKMHVRVLLSRYRAYTPCKDCGGSRFKPDTLLYLAKHESGWLTLSDFYKLPIRDALKFVEQLSSSRKWGPSEPLGMALQEVRSRLRYLEAVGLGYLTLDRPTRTLSGGETERVNLTMCLGTRLVNTLFVLDEPSVGLHPRDTERLVHILQQLRQAGNTVVVVEHEASVIRAADQIVDLGPGHGATGGEVVFQGDTREILRSKTSLTGMYLSGRRQIEVPQRRGTGRGLSAGFASHRRANSLGALELNDAPARAYGSRGEDSPALELSQVTRNNLKDMSVRIPLRRLVCMTGVSGSGKTTLMREVLLPSLNSVLGARSLGLPAAEPAATEDKSESDELDNPEAGGASPVEIEGWEQIERVVLVDQSILGKTPRSNPAVFIGAFEHIREFFADSVIARQRGLNASAFSFNSATGQCEKCRGAGFEKIEMQFLSDVFVRCSDCKGRRYRPHILEIKVAPESPAADKSRAFSIADVLDATVEEAVQFLSQFPESRPARRAIESLKLLAEVGLGYLKTGQPINTLSGGESQRLKLVRELAAAGTAPAETGVDARTTLFLFDEPTTGLHFDDVRVLLKVFQRLVDAGHSVLLIEHNLDVMKSCDWIIDLGPGAGDEGGKLVVEGTPEEVAACEESFTGQALKEALQANDEARMIPPCGNERSPKPE